MSLTPLGYNRTQQMPNCDKGMVQEHPWPTETHDLPDRLAPLGFIAMDRARRTEWFKRSLGAVLDSIMSIGEEVCAFATEFVGFYMTLPTVQADHGLNNLFLHCLPSGDHDQANRSRLSAMSIIPPITPPIAIWCSPYSSAVGNNSSSDM